LLRPARALLLSTAVLAGGCGGGPGGPSPGALAYGEPDTNPITLDFSDSTRFTVDAPGYGELAMSSGYSGTAELRFRRQDAGYDVQIRFLQLDGGTTTHAQGSTRVDETDVGGLVGVELSFTGDVVVVDSPAATAALAEVAGLDRLARSLFVSLPGRQVAVGATWVDTARTREEAAGTVWQGHRITTSTLLGDTVMADRRLLRIGVTTATEVEVDGKSGGVEVEQRLSGTLHGRILWDHRNNVLVELAEAGELTGTLEMLETGVAPMAVAAAVVRRVSLRP
jgi:hypothetical protein